MRKDHTMYQMLIVAVLAGGCLLPAGTALAQDPDLPTRYRALQKDYKALDRNEKILQKAVDDLKDKTQRMSNESDALRAELKEAAKRIAKLEDETEDCTKLLARTESERDRALEDAEELSSEKEKLQETVKAQGILVDEHGRDLRAMRKKLSGEVTSQDRSAAEDAMARANQLMDEGRVAEAAEAYRTAQASWPGIPGARIGLATYHYYSGNYDVAATLADEVLDEDSRNVDALGLRGLVAWHQDDLRKANKYLARALKERPDDDGLHVYQGMVYYEQGKNDDAAEELKAALLLNRDNVEARFNLAVVLASGEEEDLDSARLHYKAARALGVEPDAELEKILFQE